MERYGRDYGRAWRGGRQGGGFGRGEEYDIDFRRGRGPLGPGMQGRGLGGEGRRGAWYGERGQGRFGPGGGSEFEEGDFGRGGARGQRGGPWAGRWGGQELERGGYGGYGGYEPGYETGWGGGYEDEERTWRGRRGGEEEENDRIRAAEIMTEDPETVTPDVSLADAARKMRDLDVGIIPVVEKNSRRLRGVITDRDIAVRAVAEGKDANNTKVSECMTEDVETCNKNDSIRDVLEVMRSGQVRRVPITDRDGRLVGIVAQADVAVDFAAHGGPRRERKLAETIERISEPARPERGTRGRTTSETAIAARGRRGREMKDEG